MPLGTDPQSPITQCSFFVVADADSDALLRVASQLLLSNTAPHRLVLTRSCGEMLQIEAQVLGISTAAANSIRRKLQQLSCVAKVDMQCGPFPGNPRMDVARVAAADRMCWRPVALLSANISAFICFYNRIPSSLSDWGFG